MTMLALGLKSRVVWFGYVGGCRAESKKNNDREYDESPLDGMQMSQEDVLSGEK